MASKLASSLKLTKNVIDEKTAGILDSSVALFLEFSKSKSFSESIIKDIMKLIIKIGILDRSGKLNDNDYDCLDHCRVVLEKIVQACSGFLIIDYTYNYEYLVERFRDLENGFSLLIGRHLSDRSKCRLDHIFEALTDQTFLDDCFMPNKPLRELFTNILYQLKELV
ncbi:tumor necrosis factor alpha-induced protein 8-like protein [Octopus sinensis]|uniref:Tumor necrosis factor alpha-induced protein 8-like protein n=1 Tax=Octopus sinensis TaxID=2607531 RepID=A0A6P7TQK9_9MOLL|nr:tumor necrosis factor alpha-induced protein 8-like protein [Octopus sinensis]